ncbi:MAG TPA: signal peptidase II [Candidatus Caccenecus avistercoris]|nr:signal peptidase II [Candidatus Caccenecus avistercoris]
MNKKTYIIAVLILIIDQVSKSLIEIFFKLNESVMVIKDFFYITVVHNTGGAWSIFSNHSYLFIIASIVAIVLLIKFMFGFKNNLRNSIAFASLFGGIFSNLADRLFLGYVRDFLDFKIFGYDYPIFNIADIAIVVGVILLIIAVIKGEDKRDKSSK